MRAILRNTVCSFSVSWRTSESIGLAMNNWVLARNTERWKNIEVVPVLRIYRIPSRKTVSKVTEIKKHTLGDLRWNPPLYLRISIKGSIKKMPSTIIPNELPRMITIPTGIKLNSRLYVAYLYSSCSSGEMAPAWRSHFAIPADNLSIIWSCCTASARPALLAGEPWHMRWCLHKRRAPD